MRFPASNYHRLREISPPSFLSCPRCRRNGGGGVGSVGRGTTAGGVVHEVSVLVLDASPPVGVPRLLPTVVEERLHRPVGVFPSLKEEEFHVSSCVLFLFIFQISE